MAFLRLVRSLVEKRKKKKEKREKSKGTWRIYRRRIRSTNFPRSGCKFSHGLVVTGPWGFSLRPLEYTKILSAIPLTIYFLFISYLFAYISVLFPTKEVQIEGECQIDEYEIGTIKIAVPRDSSFQGYRSTSI